MSQLNKKSGPIAFDQPPNIFPGRGSRRTSMDVDNMSTDSSLRGSGTTTPKQMPEISTEQEKQMAVR